ncbi:MAG TPA: hypothetical protein VLZ74_15095 [Methylocella sp.]|nr:hypothetical protein [Methylocella sp.]
MTDEQLDPAQKMMKSLLGKLYTILMGGDSSAPASTDSFVAWLAPGIPVDPNNFVFATKGTAGKTGDETRALLDQALDFSRLVNMLPDASGVIGLDHQKATFEQTGEMLWNAYSNALNYSQVAAGDLTPDQKAKIDKFRSLLWTTKEQTNIVTGEVTTIAIEGPVLAAYNDKMASALEATTIYNNKRISAMNADDSAIVQDWALNADAYRAKVKAANAAWVSGGYKNEVNDMNAYIDQVTRRSLTLMKDHLLNQYEAGKLNHPIYGDFYITAPVAAGFAKSNGWTKFTFKESNTDSYDRSETNAWDASIKGGYGLFSAGGGSSGSIGQETATLDVTGFDCSFELVQVPISRPWFSPEFLKLKSWRFPNGGLLSDGNRPPKNGSLIGYPTTCVFVRNVRMNFNELHKADSKFTQAIKANATVNYGPFVSGNADYSRSVAENKSSTKVSDGGLEIPGMQLIALKCALLPMAPNPDPSIKQWS